MSDLDDTPASRFERYVADVERDPVWQTRQERIRRMRSRNPVNPWKTAPYGRAIVALGLLAYAIARAFGWSP